MVKAAVISHQSHFTWLTGANGPHPPLAAGLLIEKLSAVTFTPPHFIYAEHGASHISMHMCARHQHSAKTLSHI